MVNKFCRSDIGALARDQRQLHQLRRRKPAHRRTCLVDHVIGLATLPDGKRLALPDRDIELVGKTPLHLGALDPVEILENAPRHGGIKPDERTARRNADGRRAALPDRDATARRW